MGNRLRLPRYRYRYVLVILSLIIYYFSNHPKPLLNRTQTEPAPRFSLSHSVTNRKGQNKPSFRALPASAQTTGNKKPHAEAQGHTVGAAGSASPLNPQPFSHSEKQNFPHASSTFLL